MCCLKNEQEAYEHLNRSLPHIGTKTTTPEGYPGEVQSVSVLRQLVKVVFTNDNGEKEVREYPVAELQFDQKKNFGKNIPQQIPGGKKIVAPGGGGNVRGLTKSYPALPFVALLGSVIAP